MKKMNFFKKKVIIVTGHTGFKGSWLTLWLTLFGAKVIGISRDLPSRPSLFKILQLEKKITDIRQDIRNLDKLIKIFKKYQPNIVFHLAAQAIVKKSYQDPKETFTTNAIGTLNILEAIRFIKKKCYSVIITSDKSYKNLEIKRGYNEKDILGGTDPYSASKASAELIIQSYIHSFYMKKNNNKFIAIARAGNVIGGGDWSEDRLVPDCIKACSNKKTVKIRNPYSTRPWQHVFEAISGYMSLVINLKSKKKIHGEAFNFGPNLNQNYSVISLLKETKKTWPAIQWIVNNKKKKFKESNLLKLNCGKAKKVLKWSSVLSFNENIKMTMEWYKNYYNSKNLKQMKKFSENQIKEFIKLAKKRSKK